MEEDKTTEETININLGPDIINESKLNNEISSIDNDFRFLKTKLLVDSAIKKHVSTAPIYSPKNFNEQIVFYDDDTNFRLYLWINGTWRYITLT